MMSLYLMNSPSIRRRLTSVFPILNTAFLSLRRISISSASLSSDMILLISFMILAVMMKFSSVPISTGSLESARRNPSSATILTLPGVISVSMPVSMPLASSALAANAVFLTMSLKVSQLNVSLLIISLLSFIWGNPPQTVL